MEPEFLKFYRIIEASVKLRPEDFISDRETVKKTIIGIKGLAGCVREFAMKALQASGNEFINDKDMPFALASAKIISGSLADDLSDLLHLADTAEGVDPIVIYSNLVRIMETFEEAFVNIKAVLERIS